MFSASLSFLVLSFRQSKVISERADRRRGQNRAGKQKVGATMPLLLILFLRPRNLVGSSFSQLLITMNFFFPPLYFCPISLARFSLLCCFSFLTASPFLFHGLPLSLAELSVQTVEYMLSKYTSPTISPSKQTPAGREKEGQEEGRMGAQGGDVA